MVALQAIDAERREKLRVIGAFDTACHREHVKLPPNGLKRADDDLIINIARDVSGEFPVNFYDVEDEIAEVAKRGETGSEVIECE